MPFFGPCLGTILRIVNRNKFTQIICIADNVIPHEKRLGDSVLTKYFLSSIHRFVTMSEKVNEDLKTSQEALKAREAKLTELQTILARKDSTVKALKTKVTDALLGFQNNGLTVEQKNGKVYVSLEEKLLFASGSISVDAKGAEAIKSLAKVLEQNPDINILVEGHTDNVPYSSASGGIKDNWDLSVLRATSIVRIIIQSSKVNETRLTAAGRGEFFPIDKANTAEARKKNRRTEIILTPKLDELLQILEGH
jgi:chemotaxis protein MotB